jgi:predicted site-specific integrase-resolvase
MEKMSYKPRTKKELAEMYGIDIKTLNKWLLKIGVIKFRKDGYIFNSSEIKTIISSFGEP